MSIERFSHVMHIVSNVRGQLDVGRDAFDVLRACFPAGTVAGAPKIRAMEIIDELEPVARGPYAGAVGYVGYSGNMDTAITIRTLVMANDRAYIQAGAGIVADSVPEREYLETVNKAKALVRALEIVARSREPLLKVAVPR
jgi:anthranilate synthase component 1